MALLHIRTRSTGGGGVGFYGERLLASLQTTLSGGGKVGNTGPDTNTVGRLEEAQSIVQSSFFCLRLRGRRRSGTADSREEFR